MANSHLVILKKPFLDAVLDGRKSIESRFMRTRRPPFARIAAGDTLFLKVTSGPVSATARARKVMSFDNLTPRSIDKIRLSYNDRIIAPDQYWLDKADSVRGVLIWLEKIRPIKPIWIDKKDWRAWVVLTSQNNFGLLDV